MIGKPRSGKTSLLHSFFENKEILYGVYHKIYIFQPQSSRANIKNNVFSKLPDEQFYDELSAENMFDLMNNLETNAAHSKRKKALNSCVIFDDMTAYLKNKETLKLLKKLIFNRRQIRTSIYFLVQTYFSVPKDIRKLFTNCFVFRVNQQEMETIFEEIIEKDKKLVLPVLKFVYNEPYQYLFINTDSQRLFKSFDEILFFND